MYTSSKLGLLGLLPTLKKALSLPHLRQVMVIIGLSSSSLVGSERMMVFRDWNEFTLVVASNLEWNRM